MTDFVRGRTDGGKEAVTKTTSLGPLAEVEASLSAPHMLVLQLLLVVMAAASIGIMALGAPSWVLAFLP